MESLHERVLVRIDSEHRERQRSTRVSEDLVRKGYVGHTVGIKVRFADFKTVTRDVTLLEATADAAAIQRAATECLRRIILDRRLRLVGVRVSALEKMGHATPAEHLRT